MTHRPSRSRRTPGGKGDRDKTTDHQKYRDNWDRIDWKDKGQEQDKDTKGKDK